MVGGTGLRRSGSPLRRLALRLDGLPLVAHVDRGVAHRGGRRSRLAGVAPGPRIRGIALGSPHSSVAGRERGGPLHANGSPPRPAPAPLPAAGDRPVTRAPPAPRPPSRPAAPMRARSPAAGVVPAVPCGGAAAVTSTAGSSTSTPAQPAESTRRPASGGPAEAARTRSRAASLPYPARLRGARLATSSSSPAGRVPAAADARPGQGEERRRGFFGRLRENMRKTREALAAEVQATLFEGDLDEDTWERLEEALIYADVGARTTAAGRRAARAGGRGGRPRRRRGADRAARRAAGEDRAHRRRHDRHPPRAGRDPRRRRQRHRQDDDDRQARLAPAPDARAEGRDRRGRYLPRRRGRAARALGRARRVDIVKGPEGVRPRRRRLRRRRPRPRARRRRRDHRHRRAPAHPGRPDG